MLEHTLPSDTTHLYAASLTSAMMMNRLVRVTERGRGRPLFQLALMSSGGKKKGGKEAAPQPPSPATNAQPAQPPAGWSAVMCAFIMSSKPSAMIFHLVASLSASNRDAGIIAELL